MPTIRRARRGHACTERNYHRIVAGSLYLYEKCAPWSEMGNGKNWQEIKACLRCAEEFGLHNSETRERLAKELM
jgi:hypothetical protein